MKAIRLLATDVDGTLTDGTLSYIGGGEWGQRFSVRDGGGIAALQRAGVRVAFISAKNFEGTRERAKMLGIEDLMLGVSDKLAAVNQLAAKHKLSLEQIAYIGDELDDIPAIKAAGFGATVNNAPQEVQQAARYVTSAQGGKGAIRELAELILKGGD